MNSIFDAERKTQNQFGTSYQDCTLKIDVEDYKAGSKFELIVIDNDQTTITFFEYQWQAADTMKFELSYSLGRKVLI